MRESQAGELAAWQKLYRTLKCSKTEAIISKVGSPVTKKSILKSNEYANRRIA